MNVIEADAVGKRYGSTWALRGCTLAIPDGHEAAPVGPNGAGKTTMLNLAVGLAWPRGGRRRPRRTGAWVAGGAAMYRLTTRR